METISSSLLCRAVSEGCGNLEFSSEAASAALFAIPVNPVNAFARESNGKERRPSLFHS